MRVTMRRWRRAAARTIGAAVVVSVGVGLAPAPALADEPAPTETRSATSSENTSGTSDGTSTSDGDDGTTTGAATAAPTVVEAVAAAHAARVAIDSMDASGVAAGLAAVSDALAIVFTFLTSANPTAAGADPDTNALLVTAEELRRRVVEATLAGADASAVPTPPVARTLIQYVSPLLGGLSDLAWSKVSDVTNEVPTAAHVLDLARDVADYVRGATIHTAGGLLDDLARISGYLTDEQHQRTAKEALTALLLVLAHNVNPLPAALTPTTEAAFDAAGAFVAWADALVAQGVEGPGPFYEENTDTDEAPPSEDATVMDSALAVGEVVRAGGPGMVLRTTHADRPTDISRPTVLAGCEQSADHDCTWAMTRGGRVIQRPVVRVVLVGEFWHGQSHLRGGLDNLFGSLSGSGYQNILRQYWDDDGGYIGPEVVYQGAHVLDVTPPAVVPVDTIVDYVIHASAERSGWSTGKSVVWVVALPPEAVADSEDGKPQDKCGFQTYRARGGKPYVLAVADYPRDDDCMFVDDDRRGSLTVIAGHEYVGAVTNPETTGWYAGYSAAPWHLPDICYTNFFRGPGGEYVEPVWSNGDEGCVRSFTPRFAYRVNGTTKPPGDPGLVSMYTRGHSYPGAQVSVTNTENMPWLSFGPKRSYLATADNVCSPFADTAKTAVGPWTNCKRIAQPRARVEANRDATFTFALKPDGSLFDGSPDLAESFRLVAGTTWMTNTGSRSAILSDIDISRFDAEVIGVPRFGVVAVGERGMDAQVSVTLRNTGTAYWYPREVLYIGTEAPTRYRASSWPSATRAHRVGKGPVLDITPPNATYTFDLVLNIPATEKQLTDTLRFFPFVEVQRVLAGGFSVTKLTRGRIDVQLVMLQTRIMAHEVTGYGFASGDVSGTAIDESGFSCVALAGVDTTATRITECRSTVTTAAGASYTYAAATVSADGPLAWTSAAWTGYRPSDGDTISVCWTAEATFVDGTTGTISGCG